MALTFGSLLDPDGWTPMSPDQQGNSRYYWHAGGVIGDAPIDFAKTFDVNMFVTTQPIDVPGFNRNPLRVVPNFLVPRHFHNMDEMVIVFKGRYTIEYGTEGEEQSQVIRPGEFFISRAGTPYTMIAGDEGVTYIETWPEPVTTLDTVWYERGWVPRETTATPGPERCSTPVREPGEISFFSLVDGDGWAPLAVDQGNPKYFWNDGGLLADAPVDMDETFDGGMFVSSKMDPTFKMNGLQCSPGFTVPRHHHNMNELIIVFAGEYLIEGEPGDVRRVGPGEFFVSEAGTPYTMTAGPDGVTYTEQWPKSGEHLETYWHDTGWVHR